MKQKFVISRNPEKNEMIIKEYSELDKDILTLVCEETYKDEIIDTAIRQNKEMFYSTIRTDKLFPPVIYAEKIAEAVMRIYESDNDQYEELFFDDLDFITKGLEKVSSEGELEDEATDIEDLLEDGFDDSYEEKDAINNLNSTLKVADDDILDVDDEN